MSLIRNLIRNPKPVSTADWSVFNGSAKDLSMTMTDGCLRLETLTSNGASVVMTCACNDTELVGSFHVVSCTDKANARMKDAANTGVASKPIPVCEDTWVTMRCKPGGTRCQVILDAAKTVGAVLVLDRFILCTTTEWEQLQQRRIAWFDGDGITSL